MSQKFYFSQQEREDENATGNVNMRVYLQYIQSGGSILFGFSLLFCVIKEVMTLKYLASSMKKIFNEKIFKTLCFVFAMLVFSDVLVNSGLID